MKITTPELSLLTLNELFGIRVDNPVYFTTNWVISKFGISHLKRIWTSEFFVNKTFLFVIIVSRSLSAVVVI